MHPKQTPIAIVGVNAIFPGSADRDGFWRDILEGTDLIEDIPASHWLIEDYYDADLTARDKTYGKRGAFLPEVDFDPLAWGVPPSIVPATDTTQLLALIVAQRVLADASQGRDLTEEERERVSVILGVTSAQELLGSMVSRLQRPVWVKALRDSGLPESQVQDACDRISSEYVEWQESSFPGLLGNVVAGRIANRLDLHGTNCVVDAACASSFSAISMGVNELVLGQSDLVISGGADTMNGIFMYMCFSKTPALSPTGDCRPFSDQADGTLLGEGICMVALKRLEDAERAGDRVYAVLKGIGSSSDGRSKSVYAPVPEGQARAIRRAYETAGFGADTVELVEAHGTGTKAGDAAELVGLRTVFEESGREGGAWCALGSVKSQIGHTKATAGAAGLFKAVMALQHRVLPPTIKIDRPSPLLGIEDSPLYLSTIARPWIRSADHPRRAGVSSFGFGGSNFHLAVEEYVGPAEHRAERLRVFPSELVILSAGDPATLAADARALASEAATPGALRWLARDTQARFDASKPARLAVVAEDEATLAARLEQAAESIESKPEQALALPTGIHYEHGAEPGAVALLFPGQGSQYVGMGGDLAMSFEAAGRVWDQAAEVALDETTTLHEVVFPAPAFDEEGRAAQAARLTGTEWAQPALGVTSLSMLALLDSLGIEAECVGGHSYGEITALCAGGVVDAATMLAVARKRGELMAEASSTPGSMTAVRGELAAVEAALEGLGAEVVIANHNSPDQVVLSGPTEAIAKTEEALQAKGLSFTRLPVATAFHSPIVAPATVPFRSFLDGRDFSPPRVDVYSGAEAAPYPADAEGTRDLLAGQIARQVRFVEQIDAMHARGVRTFIEVGAGSVLSVLVGRCLEGRPHRAVALDRKGRHGVTSLWHGLAHLVVSGLPLSLDALWAGFEQPVDPAQAERPKMALPISGANYGQLYPPPGGAAALPAPNPEVVAPAPAPPVAAEAQPAPVPAPPAPALAPAAPDQLAWVAAFQETQRQTADAHAAWQRSMAEGHQAFLRAAETTANGLTAMVTGQAPVLSAPAPLPAPAIALPTPALAPEPAAAALPEPPALPPAAPAPAAPTPPPVAVAPEPPPAVAAAGVDLGGILLEVVADKTGYPPEMLELDMDLEADLGVDSIKRVEILAALRERVPTLQEVDPAQIGALRTLGQIVEALGDSDLAAAAPAPAAEPDAAPAVAPAVGVDLSAALLAVVADKTGYPPEMLELDMDLEADLGVDSIKRVEILSALREQVPSLQEVEASEIGALRTLGQIVDRLADVAPGAPSDPAPAVEPAPDGGPPGSGGAGQGGPAEPVAADVEPPPPTELGRWELRGVPAPALGLSPAGLNEGPVSIVGEPTVGAALVAALARRGVDASVVDEVPGTSRGVIFLGGLADAEGAAGGIACLKAAFLVARACAKRFAAEGGLFVTVQDTGGDFGLSGRAPKRAWLGGLPGLAKTAAQEWPGASVKAIDIDRGGRSAADVAEALALELLAGGAELEVGLYADGTRTTLRSVEAPAKPARLTLNGRSVVLASGGARGVTAASLVALAKECGPRIALLGRTPLDDEPASCQGIDDEAALGRALLADAKAAGEALSPADLGARVRRVLSVREVRGTLAALKEAGSRARYISVDITDVSAVRAAADEIRTVWGPITGVIHGAGVLADKRLEDKTEEGWDRVVATKVLGLDALLRATRNDHLEVLCVYSSVAGRSGNVGQADYAAANEVLNKVAGAEQARRGAACVVRSLNWGPWEGGMVTPALKAAFEAAGVALIPRERGAEMFVGELAGGGGVEVVLGGAPRPAPLLGAEGQSSLTLLAHVSAVSHPHLRDHSIGGTPVLPAVLAVELLVRAAATARPDLSLRACSEVKILRGIRLEGFATTGDWLRTGCREISNGRDVVLALELTDGSGRPCYSAKVELGQRLPTPAVAPTATELPVWNGDDVYDGDVLFHGPAFQVIQSVDGVTDAAAGARLTTTLDAGWPAEAWRTDPAALDGALQLALLHANVALGGPALPTSIGAIRLFNGGPSHGPVRCLLTGRVAGEGRALADITLLDASGAVVAELQDVETHARPAKAPEATGRPTA